MYEQFVRVDKKSHNIQRQPFFYTRNPLSDIFLRLCATMGNTKWQNRYSISCRAFWWMLSP